MYIFVLPTYNVTVCIMDEQKVGFNLCCFVVFENNGIMFVVNPQILYISRILFIQDIDVVDGNQQQLIHKVSHL